MFRANHQISLVFQRAARRSRYVFLALRAVGRGLGLHVWIQSSSLIGIFNGLLGGHAKWSSRISTRRFDAT